MIFIAEDFYMCHIWIQQDSSEAIKVPAWEVHFHSTSRCLDNINGLHEHRRYPWGFWHSACHHLNRKSHFIKSCQPFKAQSWGAVIFKNWQCVKMEEMLKCSLSLCLLSCMEWAFWTQDKFALYAKYIL